MSLIFLYTPWKHQKTRILLMFSGGIERDQWHEMFELEFDGTDFSIHAFINGRLERKRGNPPEILIKTFLENVYRSLFWRKVAGCGSNYKWTPPQVLFFNFVKFYRRPNVKNPSDKRDKSIWHLYLLSPTASVFTYYLFVVWLSSILNSCWDHSSFL